MVTLNSPISWINPPTADDAAMLAQLQPNILKPHTRDFMVLLFLQFTDPAGGRAFLRDVAADMKSALEHLEEIRRFKEQPSVPGTPYLGVGLTAPGYAALGIAVRPADASFNAGMQAATLNDPQVSGWDAHFRVRDRLHAVIAIGDARMEPVSRRYDEVVAKINAHPGVVVLGTQDGRGLHNANGDGIEHFGYVDGRSQPLFFTEDLDAERLGSDGTANWDPAAPLGQAIVPDPAAPDPAVHFGSYFVFRKLEQDVKRFKEEEAKFAEALQSAFPTRLDPDDFERAGALLVGRFEDGTPVTAQSAAGSCHPVPNNFNYDSDDQGGKCPFFGHVRKTNPRGTGGFENPADERRHQMARRGQTYGVRVDNPNDGRTDNKPSGNVGLLFMAFNSNIADQFEFMQSAWANFPGFPKNSNAGVDPIIGQLPPGQPRPRVQCPVKWGSTDKENVVTVDAIPQTVTMQGGEYFFMPSLAFLRALT